LIGLNVEKHTRRHISLPRHRSNCAYSQAHASATNKRHMDRMD
jgi:hypothetical protein